MKNSILGGSGNQVSNQYSLAFGKGVIVDDPDDYVAAFFSDEPGAHPGKVGINEPSPTAELEVNGTVKITQILHLEPITEPATGDEGDIYYDADTHKLRVWVEPIHDWVDLH